MTCPTCGATIDDESTTCPECGASLAAATTRKKASPVGIAIGIAATVVALLFLGVIPAIGTAAIALMWVAPNSFSLRGKVIITIVLVAAIVSLPILMVASGTASFTF